MESFSKSNPDVKKVGISECGGGGGVVQSE
jgi:hypothetical protein